MDWLPPLIAAILGSAGFGALIKSWFDARRAGAQTSADLVVRFQAALIAEADKARAELRAQKEAEIAHLQAQLTTNGAVITDQQKHLAELERWARTMWESTERRLLALTEENRELRVEVGELREWAENADETLKAAGAELRQKLPPVPARRHRARPVLTEPVPPPLPLPPFNWPGAPTISPDPAAPAPPAPDHG